MDLRYLQETYIAPYSNYMEENFASKISSQFRPVTSFLETRVFSQTGLPLDVNYFLFLMFMAYPISLLQRSILSLNFTNSKTNTAFIIALRHLVNLTVGLLFVFFSFGFSASHALVLSTSVYLILAILPRKWSHKVVFVFALSYMTICHIYRMVVDYLGWTLDFTGPVMLITLKSISIAFNYHDGYLDEKLIVSKTHKELRIHRFPNPLEFFGYMFFYPSILSGPVFEYSHYIYAMSSTKLSTISPIQIFKKISFAFVAMGLYQLVNGFFNVKHMLEPSFALLPFWKKLVYLNFISWFRLKYYIGWFIAEGSLLLSGFPYEYIEQSDFIGTEFATNPRDTINGWNKSVSRFLRNYVYTRVPGNKKTGKPGFKNTLSSFLISALWHGLYVGYYNTFFLGAVYLEIAKVLHSRIAPRLQFLEKNPVTSIIYTIILWAINNTFFGYIVTSFNTLDYNLSIQAYSYLYFSLHIFIILAFLLVNFIPPVKKNVTPGSITKKD